MKYAFFLFLITALIACHDKKPAIFPRRPPLVINDSGMIRNAPANPYVPVDVSPMDMSYLPKDYPMLHMSGKAQGPPVARVIYSRPHRQGRTIFGHLLHWGQPWRLGANEATELQLFQPMMIEGKKVPKGRYILYCIPQPGQWKIIFNTKTDAWGLQQDASKNIYQFTAPVKSTVQRVEHFTMEFEPTAAGADLLMVWDEVEARLPLQLHKAADR